MAKSKITRIKAGESSDSHERDEAESPILRKKVVVKDKKQDKIKQKEARLAAKAEKATERDAESNGKKVFVLFRPFAAFFRYLRNSWKEIRQVRWPNRKATWKMVLAVLAYTAVFVLLISLLDLFFTWLFNLILGN